MKSCEPYRGHMSAAADPPTRPSAEQDDELPYYAEFIAQALSRINHTRIAPETMLDLVTSHDPPTLRPGTLRPYVDMAGAVEYSDLLDRAVKMLLYTPEVIVWGPEELLDAHGLEAALDVVPALVAVWDLVEDGSLIVREMGRPLGGPAGRLDTPEVYEPLGFSASELDHWLDQATAIEMWPGKITPWFLTERQRQVAADVIQQASVTADHRVLAVSKLAALELPALSMHASDLIAVRRNSDAFGEWRQQLQAALSQVELLPDNDQWQREARAIIADAMTVYTERVRAETARSTALSKAVIGMKQMALAGIGGAVGEVLGGSGALVGLGSAGATALVAGIAEWAKAQRDAAPQRAALGLSMIFDDRPT